MEEAKSSLSYWVRLQECPFKHDMQSSSSQTDGVRGILFRTEVEIGRVVRVRVGCGPEAVKRFVLESGRMFSSSGSISSYSCFRRIFVVIVSSKSYNEERSHNAQNHKVVT